VQFVPLERSGLGTFSELRKLVDIAAKDAESQYGKCLFKAKTDKVKKQTSGRKQFVVCASSEAPVENNSQFTVTCVLCSGVCYAVLCVVQWCVLCSGVCCAVVCVV